VYKEFHASEFSDEPDRSLLCTLLQEIEGRCDPRWMTWPDRPLKSIVRECVKYKAEEEKDRLLAALDTDLTSALPTLTTNLRVRCSALSALRFAIEQIGATKKSWTADAAYHCLSALHRATPSYVRLAIKPILLSFSRAALQLPLDGRFDPLRGKLLGRYRDVDDGAIIRRKIDVLFGLDHDFRQSSAGRSLEDSSFEQFIANLGEHLQEIAQFRERVRPYPAIVAKLRDPTLAREILNRVKPPAIFRGKEVRLPNRIADDGTLRLGMSLIDWQWFSIFRDMDTPLIDRSWLLARSRDCAAWDGEFWTVSVD
jgi:hypothetical protein